MPTLNGLRVEVHNDLLANTLRTTQPYSSNGTLTPEAVEGLCQGIAAQPQAAAIVPLLLDNYPLGALWCVRFARVPYTPTDMIGLERLADQAVIAIQHGLMAVQMQSLAVMDERARIAREMHDGLAQILGYMNLQVQTLEALLKQDQRDSLFAELQQMREAVQTAHADVRENILSLRTTLATDSGVASAIEEYLDGFSVQTGISVQFANHAGDELGLSPLAEVQLVCILQEALANVRKHAQAENVSVLLERINGQAYLDISDDGIGFEGPVALHRFGLQTMQERAQSVGGQLTIHSQAGSGTRITCQLPVVERDHIRQQVALVPEYPTPPEASHLAEQGR